MQCACQMLEDASIVRVSSIRVPHRGRCQEEPCHPDHSPPRDFLSSLSYVLHSSPVVEVVEDQRPLQRYRSSIQAIHRYQLPVHPWQESSPTTRP
jgi:hypothetical protein